MSAVATPAERQVEVGASRPPRRRSRRRLTRFILPTYSFLLIAYLALPVFVMIVFGFNDLPGTAERQTSTFTCCTLDWYKNLFGVPGLTDAVKTSLALAPLTALFATIMGTLIGLALGRYRFTGRGATNFVIFLAIAVPEIVLASSLLTLFVTSQFPSLGFATILLSHIGFSIAFVAVTVRARVEGLDRSLENAAQDLFATPWVAFYKVTLPLIAPGIIAGFLLAFVLSLDDFVITNFVSGPVQTFPVWVFGATRIGLPPQVNVMATLLFAAGLVFAGVNVASTRRQRGG